MIFFRTLRLPPRSSLPCSLFPRYLTSSTSPQHSIYISKSTNPYFNLTFEDWLFRHKNPNEPLLLIYRDDPCVVIGRNQNPWKEINFDALRTRPGVPFIRRRSGGGTVYHDLGNTNFSIHLPRQSFDRHVTAQIVFRAVRSMGVDACMNERNDICIGKDKMSLLMSWVSSKANLHICPHISGSAYKIVNTRAYHHGTMLISTHLNDLGDILRTNKETMVTKGVASVRSPVCNIRQSYANVDHASFAAAVISEFRKEYKISEEVIEIDELDNLLAIDYIKNGMNELPSWNWAYGQTPEFTYTVHNTFSWGTVSVKIVSKHGLILSCILSIVESRLSTEDTIDVFRLAKTMEGQRYGFVNDILVMASSTSEAAVNVSSWLKTAMC